MAHTLTGVGAATSVAPRSQRANQSNVCGGAPNLGALRNNRGVSSLSPLIEFLRCIECGAHVKVASIAAHSGYPHLGPDGVLACDSCGERFPLIAGTARMLTREFRHGLREAYPLAREAWNDPNPDFVSPQPFGDDAAVKLRTAESFAYEWERFGGPRTEWRRNFLDYLQPHGEDFFAGRLVLDVGTGSGRHSARAAQLGAQVIAVDLGQAIDIARRNLPDEVLTVQADAERLPFERGAFDLVMSIGVLHHLPDTERALAAVSRHARPGGTVHVYLYWQPERRWHRTVLRGVSRARRATTRLPHPLLRLACYPLAAILMAGIVIPYKILRQHRLTEPFARTLPLKTYADYPFGVLVNDQFDRFSAPLERRFSRVEVANMLLACGLVDTRVLPNAGWVGDGVVPQVGTVQAGEMTAREL